jgi:8-oxo-dGTP diphosphatase
MERRINVRGIIVDNNGNLFAVKHRSHDGSESHYWAIPGGGLNAGESLHDSLSREMVEEIGIKPIIDKLLFIQQFIHRRDDGSLREELELFFYIKNYTDYQANIDLATTTHGDTEIARTAFINPSKESLLPEFLQTIDMDKYIKNDQPVYIYNELD